jgi:putative DNA primase/helicase
MRPILRLAADAAEDFKAKELAAAVERDVIETAIAKLKRQAAMKHGDPESIREELRELMERRERTAVVKRRYTTADPTIEKLGELLNQNPAGLLLLRDELTGWLKGLEKPGRESDRAFYIEAWDGLGRYEIDRVGRGSISVEALTVSIFGTIQPGRLRSYIAAAVDQTAEDDGMLQRFQVVVWPDFPAGWVNVDRWPDRPARQRAFSVFEAVSRIDGPRPSDGDVPAIRFTPEAQDLFDAWRTELERRLRSEEFAQTPAFESHVAKFRKLMPALALILHVAQILAESPSVSCVSAPVGLESAKKSAGLVDFFEAHARRIYWPELGRLTQPMLALEEKIQTGAVRDGHPVRDVRRHQWSGLRTQAEVEAAIAGLAALDWVRIEDRPTKGRSERLIRLNPSLRKGDGDGC